MKMQMRFLAVAILLLVVGCSPTVRLITESGQPVPTNVVTMNSAMGLRVTQAVIRTYTLKEGDENLVLKEYLEQGPSWNILPEKNTLSIKIHVIVQNPNKAFYKIGMKKTLVGDHGQEKVMFSKVEYQGDLSYREFVFTTTSGRLGKGLECRVVFWDAKGNLRAMMPPLRYSVEGGGAVSRVRDKY